MTRPAELRDLPAGELVERLDSAKEELFNLRFQMATGQLDNPMAIKDVRHEVARILTILRERELAELEGEETEEAGPADEPEDRPDEDAEEAADAGELSDEDEEES